MKTKVLLLIALFFASSSFASAQSEKTTSAKYQGEVLVGLGVFDQYNLYAHTVHGVRFNENLFVGVGTGMTSFLPINMRGASGSSYAIPLFLNVKGYHPIGAKTSLYASLDAGGLIGVSGQNSGVMLSPAIGLSFNNRITFSIGYEYQSLKSDYFGWYDMGVMPVKIGFTF